MMKESNLKRIRKHLFCIAEEGELNMHNCYLMEDMIDKVKTIDDWLNRTDGKFDETHFKHIDKLAIISDMYNKLEELTEEL